MGRFIRGASVFAAAALVVLAARPESAHAGIVDNVKGFFQLPDKVDKLQEQYDAARAELDRAAQQSKETIERYRLAEQQLHDENAQLMAQNEQLVARNDQLAAAVADLQTLEHARAVKSKRLWTAVYIGGGVLALYIVSGRLLRLLLRGRQT